MKILFLIRSLERGGAERQLCVLAKALSDAGHEVHVCTFYRAGNISHYRDMLVGTGVVLHDLGKSGRWDMLGFLFRCHKLAFVLKPDVVHGYLPTGNILATFCKILQPRVKLVFGIRSAVMHLQFYDCISRCAYWLERHMASIANLVIANSSEGGELYRAKCPNVFIIPNGIDVEKFYPQAEVASSVRKMWQIGQDAFLIGMVARIDPMKDHETFLHAATLFAESHPEVRFVFVGGGNPSRREKLQKLSEELGIGSIVIWAGEFDDMPACYNAFDLVTLTSKGEGFPNAIAEAMACGVVPVASDVGAVSELVGDAGGVVPVGDALALKKAWESFHDLTADQLKAVGVKARERIVLRFSTATLAQESEKIITSMLEEDD
ncbi:glycosyltransferase [Thalassospira povalilytica]|uniref:glycosyltransferase n=1 Tax=Thalassospira povalilytica TaxID=732237 RepID=UPI003AA8B950